MTRRFASPTHLRTSLVALLGCLTIGGVLAWAPTRLIASDPIPRDRRAEIAADQIAKQIEAHLLDRFEAINDLTHPSVMTRLENAPHFHDVVDPVLDAFPELQAINFIDRAHVIRWIVPQEGNEAALHADLSLHPVAGPVLARVIETTNPQVTPPIRLLQGGRGIAAYFPHYDETDTLDGYLNAVFRLDPLITSCLPVRTADAFHVVIRDGNEIVYQSDPRGATEHPDATAHLTMLSRIWTLDLHLK